MKNQPLTKKDLDKLSKIVNNGFVMLREEVDNKFNTEVYPLHKKIDNLHTSMDKYLNKTENWHLEFKVLEAQFKKVQRVLLSKKIATEEELSLQG